MMCISSLDYTLHPSRENFEKSFRMLPQTLPNMRDQMSSVLLFCMFFFCPPGELFWLCELVYMLTNAVRNL
jgi:hypothetical protein